MRKQKWDEREKEKNFKVLEKEEIENNFNEFNEVFSAFNLISTKKWGGPKDKVYNSRLKEIWFSRLEMEKIGIKI